jgi:hypothetical protein
MHRCTLIIHALIVSLTFGFSMPCQQSEFLFISTIYSSYSAFLFIWTIYPICCHLPTSRTLGEPKFPSLLRSLQACLYKYKSVITIRVRWRVRDLWLWTLARRGVARMLAPTAKVQRFLRRLRAKAMALRRRRRGASLAWQRWRGEAKAWYSGGESVERLLRCGRVGSRPRPRADQMSTGTWSISSHDLADQTISSSVIVLSATRIWWPV